MASSELRRKLRVQRHRLGESPGNTSFHDIENVVPFKDEGVVQIGNVKLMRQQFEPALCSPGDCGVQMPENLASAKHQNHWQWDPDPQPCPPPVPANHSAETAAVADGPAVDVSIEDFDVAGGSTVPPPARMTRSPGALRELLRQLPDAVSPSWIGSPGLSETAEPPRLTALDLTSVEQHCTGHLTSGIGNIAAKGRSLWSALESPIDLSTLSCEQPSQERPFATRLVPQFPLTARSRSSSYDSVLPFTDEEDGAKGVAPLEVISLAEAGEARMTQDCGRTRLARSSSCREALGMDVCERESSTEDPTKEVRLEPIEYVLLDYLHSLPPAFVEKLKFDIQARDDVIERLRQRNRELKQRGPAEANPRRKLRRSLTAPSLPLAEQSTTSPEQQMPQPRAAPGVPQEKRQQPLKARRTGLQPCHSPSQTSLRTKAAPTSSAIQSPVLRPSGSKARIPSVDRSAVHSPVLRPSSSKARVPSAEPSAVQSPVLRPSSSKARVPSVDPVQSPVLRPTGSKSRVPSADPQLEHRRRPRAVDLSKSKVQIARLSDELNTSMERCKRRDEEGRALAQEAIRELQALMLQR